MAEYHVGCGLTGIYAGTLNKNGTAWRTKTKVTNEALNAVAEYMYGKIQEGEKSFAYGFITKGGKYLKLEIEVLDCCPEWAEEQLGEKET